MAAPIRPASSKAFQREKWVYVPAIANIEAPTLAELNAATGLDVSCYLFASSGKPTQNTNLVTRERRLCDGAQYQQVGTTTYEGGDMLAAFDPQAVAASDGKKAYEKFPEGTSGFLVRRLGVAVGTDFSAGQFVDSFPVEFGPPMPTTAGDGESAENAFMSRFAITGPPAFNKAIAA